jgi:hypothetical protein
MAIFSKVLRVLHSMFQFFKTMHFCLKFSKGIYVYRQTSDDFSLIAKGLYVKNAKNDI